MIGAEVKVTQLSMSRHLKVLGESLRNETANERKSDRACGGSLMTVFFAAAT